MKQKFSTHWKGSVQPRKQRKYLANAYWHINHKLISANLSKKLREKYKRRSFPVRKDDVVKIMRGEFKKKTGKVENIDYKRSRVIIDGIFRTKKDGTKVKVYFTTSNLQIQELNLNDKMRLKSLQRNKEVKRENKELKENAPKKK